MDSAMNDAYLSMAIIKYEAGRYKEAIVDLDRVIGTDTEYLPEAYFYRAESRYFLGDKLGACEDWQLAGDLGDTEADDYYYKFCVKDEEKIERVRRPKRGVISF
jgi:tetratricopeptide (TPR) repeat protein